MISTRKSCTSGISKWCMAGSWITFGILRPLGPVSPDLSGSTGIPFVPRPVPWTDASSNSSSSHINVDSSRAVGQGLGVDHADRVLSMQMTPPLEDLPLPATSEEQRVGTHLAAFAPQRQSLLGNCRASCTLGDSHVGAGCLSSCLFPGAKEHRGSMSCHRSFPPEWPSGHLQFKMETQASVRSSIRERECTMSIDIQDAYLRIPMARPIQKYFQFIVIGWVYQFSLAASLWESTKAVRCPQGVNLHVYLDYWLICASSPVQANLVLRVLQQHLGWVIHFSKSDLPPRQQFNFIHMQFSMCTYTVTPLPKMGIKIQNTLDHWRSHTLASPPTSYSSSLGVFPFQWKGIHFSNKKFECPEVTSRQDITMVTLRDLFVPQTFGHVDLYGHPSANGSRSVCDFANRKLPVFASPFLDLGAKYVDAMPVLWDGNGVHPPIIQNATGCTQDSRSWWSVSDFGSSAPDGSIMDAGATQAVSVSSLSNGRASTSQTRSLNAQRSRQDKTLPWLLSGICLSHRLLGMLTFMVTLVPRGQFCFCPIQWWASEAWCQETGSWSDRISVAPTILHPVAGWASCSAAWGLTECLTDRDHSLYRCIQAQMEAQLGSHKLQGMWSRQQASQHINMRWRQCSWV